MRLLVVVQGGGGSRVSGPEIRAWSLAEAFSEDHDVTVMLHGPDAPERDGLRLAAFSRGALVREARRHDAVIAPQLPPYLLPALQGSGTVAVSDQYDPVELELSVFTEQPGIVRYLRAQKMIREAQLRYADVVMCAGERQRELAEGELDALGVPAAGRPAIVTVPFGLPAPPPHSAGHPLRDAFPGIGEHDPVVLWWGKIWKWFDAVTAIEAFADVVAAHPTARLVLSAGKAPTAKFDRSDRTEAARERSRDLGLLDRNVFFFEEWTRYDERHAYIGDADIGLTLHADTPEAPFAARARYMDYLWCALPCVLAGGDEIADGFGAARFAHLVAPRDRDATARAISRLIEQPEARAAARAAGLALAERYRWSTLAQPLAAAIEKRRRSGVRRHSARLARSVGTFYLRRSADHAVERARAVVAG